MGDAKSSPVRLSFNPQLRVEFHGATVTSDARLLLPRELDERLGLSGWGLLAHALPPWPDPTRAGRRADDLLPCVSVLAASSLDLRLRSIGGVTR